MSKSHDAFLESIDALRKTHNKGAVRRLSKKELASLQGGRDCADGDPGCGLTCTRTFSDGYSITIRSVCYTNGTKSTEFVSDAVE